MTYERYEILSRRTFNYDLSYYWSNIKDIKFYVNKETVIFQINGKLREKWPSEIFDLSNTNGNVYSNVHIRNGKSLGSFGCRMVELADSIKEDYISHLADEDLYTDIGDMKVVLSTKTGFRELANLNWVSGKMCEESKGKVGIKVEFDCDTDLTQELPLLKESLEYRRILKLEDEIAVREKRVKKYSELITSLREKVKELKGN